MLDKSVSLYMQSSENKDIIIIIIIVMVFRYERVFITKVKKIKFQSGDKSLK